MLYYQCKCGNMTSWSSMGVSRCSRCPECGSDLAETPSLHRPPVDHDFTAVSQVETDEGMKPLSRCRYCDNTPAEIARLEERAVERRRGPGVSDR